MACCGAMPAMKPCAAVSTCSVARPRPPPSTSSTSSTHGHPAHLRTPHGCPTKSSISSSPSASPLSSPSTATHGSFTGSHIAATTTTTSTYAATKKRAPPPPPSTCAYSTTLTASNSLSTPSGEYPGSSRKSPPPEQWYSEQIQRHKLYVSEYGDDLPESEKTGAGHRVRHLLTPLTHRVPQVSILRPGNHQSQLANLLTRCLSPNPKVLIHAVFARPRP